jgi:hypothetical protein
LGVHHPAPRLEPRARTCGSHPGANSLWDFDLPYRGARMDLAALDRLGGLPPGTPSAILRLGSNLRFEPGRVIHTAAFAATNYRGARIRTGDLCVPNAALYRTEPRPGTTDDWTSTCWAAKTGWDGPRFARSSRRFADCGSANRTRASAELAFGSLLSLRSSRTHSALSFGERVGSNSTLLITDGVGFEPTRVLAHTISNRAP